MRSIEGELVTTYFVQLDKWGVIQHADVFDIRDEKALKGSSIRFGEFDPDDGTLCIAESVVDALAIHAATGWPCWTSYSLEGMADIAVPEEITTVFVFENKHRSEKSQRGQTLTRRLKTEGKYSAVVHRNSRRKPPNSFGWRNAALIHTRKRPCAGDAHFATLC